MTSHPVSIGAGPMKLSGRFLPATNGQPRALLVALHGGGNTSKYFDTSPPSLLDLCASLGYSYQSSNCDTIKKTPKERRTCQE